MEVATHGIPFHPISSCILWWWPTRYWGTALVRSGRAESGMRILPMLSENEKNIQTFQTYSKVSIVFKIFKSIQTYSNMLTYFDIFWHLALDVVPKTYANLRGPECTEGLGCPGTEGHEAIRSLWTSLDRFGSWSLSCARFFDTQVSRNSSCGSNFQGLLRLSFPWTLQTLQTNQHRCLCLTSWIQLLKQPNTSKSSGTFCLTNPPSDEE